MNEPTDPDALADQPLPADIVGMLEGLTSTRAIRRYTDEPTTEDIKRKYLDARLLVIDDLGAGQRGTEFESALLSDLLCERYRGTWATIITTNLGGSQMTEFLGQRVVDRIEEVARKVEFTWDSYRRGSRRRRGQP